MSGRRARASTTIACVALVGTITHCDGAAPQDDGQGPQRARVAEAEFRRWGRGRFDVIAFQASPERHLEFTDDFHFATRLQEVPFDATVRFTRDVTIEPIVELSGRPDWTPDAADEAYEWSATLGPGTWAAGATHTVQAAAMFDQLEPGWRFRTFDHRR